MATEKSWHGRLTASADAITAELLASIDIDKDIWRYDIAGSIAHAQMLSEQKIITAKEFQQIKKGLLSVAADIEAGTLPMPVELEDIHMVIESALTERAGDAGRKLHTGRSRNDQVALDLRMWARDAADNLIDAIETLQRAFVELAREQGKIVLPAYTHLQRAQPILAGHGLMAYVEMLGRDVERLADCRKRIDVSPLGSGAVAGTSINLDRKRTAELLGFSAISRNSIDATSDRDFLIELAFGCATVAMHLSRWCEDWILYSSTEFGMLQLHDAYCTSSSMMPQKKNADTLELIRGKTATAFGSLMSLLTMVKSLPLAYNRDMQDDKRFAFATVKQTLLALQVAPGIVSTAKFREAAIAASIDEGFLDATALAEYLVNRGVPFRTAHHIVGQLVATAETHGASLSELDLATFQAASPAIAKDVYTYLTAKNVVKRYAPDGAGGQKQLTKQLAFWSRKLK